MKMLVRWCVAACLLGAALAAFGQDAVAREAPYTRRHTFTVFAEDAPDSSHILFGASRQRVLTDLGFAYAFRVVRFWGAALHYQAEVRPILFESDPLTLISYTETFAGPSGPVTFSGSFSNVGYSKCTPSSGTTSGNGNNPGPTSYSYTSTCGRQWTFGQAFSPAGLKFSFRARHRVQPYATGSLGYMYTSRPVPLADASPFNYLIQAGAGVEFYRSARRSVAAEVRLSHFSNWNTATENPGTDQMLYRVNYSFGHWRQNIYSGKRFSADTGDHVWRRQT